MNQIVGFIGLGNMGSGMAANLVKAGFTVKAFDLVQSHLDAAVEAGCSAASSAEDAVKNSDFVITMLPNGAIVEKLMIGNGEQGLFNQIAQQTLVLDCSTVSPENARNLGRGAEAKGIAFVDAPVSGGVAAASAGSLAFMVGGSEDNFNRAKSVLQAMGNNIFRAGDVGAGAAAKICNNMLLAIHMTGTAEALQLGVDNGLDPSVLSEIMLASSGCNWSLQKYNPYPGVMDSVPASNDYQGGFLTDLMLKDLGLAHEASLATGSSIPMGSAARNLFNIHKKSGEKDKGQLDFSSIQQLYSSTIDKAK